VPTSKRNELKGQSPGWRSTGASSTPRKDFAYFHVPARLWFKMKLKSWIKTMGFWGILFFLIKGLLWLSIPALIALFAD
jgi:hypothetical protein